MFWFHTQKKINCHQMVSIFFTFSFFVKNEKFWAIFRDKRKKNLTQIIVKIAFFSTNIAENFNFCLVTFFWTWLFFIFCQIFAIFQYGTYWRLRKIVKKIEQMKKINLSLPIFYRSFFVETIMIMILPTTSKNPLSLTIGSVFIWHIYHPRSDSWILLICNLQMM